MSDEKNNMKVVTDPKPQLSPNVDPEFRQRRGLIKIPRELIVANPNSKLLAAIFSNFFPFGTEVTHNRAPYDGVALYGYCSDFDILMEGEAMPSYGFIIEVGKDGTPVYKGMERSEV